MTTAEKGSAHDYPWFLPDGCHFLYTQGRPGSSELYLADLDARDSLRARRSLQSLEASASTNPTAKFAAPGFLLFVRARSLIALPFNAGDGRVTGNAIRVATGLDRFTVSRNGVLAYSQASATPVQLSWFDRGGKPEGVVGIPSGINGPAISPDGGRVAHDTLSPDARSVDVWAYNLARGTESRLTFSPNSSVSDFPLWSPDGNCIAFRRAGQDKVSILEQSMDSSQETVLDDNAAYVAKFPQDWSRDGRYIIEQVSSPETNQDIWVIPLTGDKSGDKPGKPFPYLQAPFNETWAKLSPDGKWLAYTSDETTRNEVYVQEFSVSPTGRTPGAGGK